MFVCVYLYIYTLDSNCIEYLWKEQQETRIGGCLQGDQMVGNRGGKDTCFSLYSLLNLWNFELCPYN